MISRSYPGLKAAAVRLANQHRPKRVLIEDTSVGSALIAELRRSGVNVRGVTPRVSKQVRASVQSATFEGGRVYLPRQAPWLREFEDELFAFPGGKHDDQVDSMVQALADGPTTPRTTTTIIKI